MSGSDDASDDPNLVVVPLDDDLSDGKKETWPLHDAKFVYTAIDDTSWRSFLATKLVEENGASEDGVTYTLEKLPRGYCLFDRPRASNTGRDPFLFGHPSGIYFQSRVTFFVHFQWLMSERSEPCRCICCTKVAKSKAAGLSKPARSSTSASSSKPGSASKPANSSKPTGSSKSSVGVFKPTKGMKRIRRTREEIAAGLSLETVTAKRGTSSKNSSSIDYILGPVGQEGPDYWRAWIMQMEKVSPEPVNIQVHQPLNKNWVFGKNLLDNHFVRLGLDATFIPRTGETVLWLREMDGTLQWNRDTRTYQVMGYDGKWQGIPEWKAGIITQTPVSEYKTIYPTDIHDLTSEKNLDNVTNTGFRIECLPDPIDDDKSLSKHASYVPLKNIKPMNSWEIFLDKVPREKWHPTIEFALTTTGSFSMLHNQWFRGTWPNARIYSKGIWVGHELLAVRDTIRLKPFRLTIEDLEDPEKANETDRRVTDVMTITDIWLEWTDCINDPEADGYAKQATAWIQGKVYTLDKDRMSRPTPFGNKPLEKLSDHQVDCAFNQVGMSEYGDWYLMNGGNTCQITPGSVLGRCYEPVPTKLHFGSFDLDYDLQSVLKARRYSSQVDNRIPDGHLWFFGDNRVETLGLAEMNGIEVGPAAEVHQQPDRWVAILKINEGIHNMADIRMADLGEGGKGGRSRKTFEDIGKTSRLVSTGLGLGSSTEDTLSDSEEGLLESELTRPIPYGNPVESDAAEPDTAPDIQVVIDTDDDEEYAEDEA